MPVIPSSPLYRPALLGPHQRAARIDVYDIDGNLLENDIPVLDGSVTANLTSRVSRTAQWSLTDEFWPRTPTDLLAPERAVVQIRAGIRYGDDTEELFPVFRGRVLTPTRESDGGVSFTADDLAADVIGFRFETPRVARPSLPSVIFRTLPLIRVLITEALPQAQFKPDGVVDGLVPDLVWDEDRGQALDDLAGSRGGRWFPDGAGVFSVQPIVYTPGAAVATFADGTAGGNGLLSRASISKTRNGVVNSVTVVAERQDGTDPVRVTVRDTGLASPTRFGGPFGRVSKIIKVQTPLTTAEAQDMARAELGAGVALTEQWSVDVVPDHTLEPDDTISLSHRGYTGLQVIDSITYPLGLEPMTINGRGTVLVQDA